MPGKGEPVKLLCRACGKQKRADEFFYSRRKQRPTKICRLCANDPRAARSVMGNESTQEMILYFSHIRSLMEEIHKAQVEAAKEGLPIDRPLTSLGDIWVSQMTEEAYTAIVQALIAKASSGDVNAAKLLLEERHRRAGEPTPESVEESFEALFSLDPLSTGHDSE